MQQNVVIRAGSEQIQIVLADSGSTGLDNFHAAATLVYLAIDAIALFYWRQ
jgi:hypothetical protein